MLQFQELENKKLSIFRPVYLRTNPNFDEALMIGIVLQNENNIELIKIDSPSALSTLKCLYDESAQEQLIFSLKILKDYIGGTGQDITNIREPISNIRFGKVSEFESDNPKQFAHEFLQMASSLYKYTGTCKKSSKTITNEVATRKLYDAATKINLVAATQLFRGFKLKVDKVKPIKLPIYGDLLVGASVSMITSQLNVAKNYGEAFIAKLSYARSKIDRVPAIYVLTPSYKDDINQSQVEDSIGELKLLADAHDVLMRQDKDINELAHAVLYDDKKIA